MLIDMNCPFFMQVTSIGHSLVYQLAYIFFCNLFLKKDSLTIGLTAIFFGDYFCESIGICL